ncbi:MBL fold metallo-hydrolase [Amycolatopsis sp. K13G38]|uniref:MBL fold metallo-hydrolase n=1 Tax=Amycolatopsis acididurans TaxID=2724524 RepID=A0ABX1J1Y2_9PSEU|nr:MBL fold metallo-hydrolase [Amycolatopsis acididurans]NKQ52276.1 MBL fold metallo-hydrolase [Amycolatopsis acididurans]
MRLTKLGHACVRIEHDNGVLVLDPGVFTDPAAMDGATAVLLTHEHPDHYLPDHLKLTDAPVYTISAVADLIRKDAPAVAERTTVVAPGEGFRVDGLPVTTVGEQHAVLHPHWPVSHNSGYVIEVDDSVLYHPGDAFTPPGRDIDILLAPTSAPWARAYELIDFMQEVKAPVNIAIHDRIYSEAGAGIIDMQAGAFLTPEGQEFKRLKDGEDL